MSTRQLEWCAMLAKLVAPMQAPEAAQAFKAMLPMLPAEDDAYNKETLELAAKREPGDPAVPNFDKLNRAFATWRRQRMPVRQRMGANPEVPRIEAPPREVSPEEVEYVRNLLAVRNVEIAQQRQARDGEKRQDGDPRPIHLNTLQIALSMPRLKAMERPDLRYALEQFERDDAAQLAEEAE